MAIDWKPIDKINEGEVLAEDLYDRTSFNVLLSKGTKVNKEVLTLLKSREILWLPIEVKETGELERIRSSIDFDQEIIKSEEPMAAGLKLSIQDQMYHTFIDSFKQISEELKIGGKIDPAPIESTVGLLVDEMMTQKEFVVNLFRKHSSGYLYKHGINTAVISLMIGVTLSMSRYHLVPLAQAAVFHDIGLMFLDDPEYVDIGRMTEREKLLQHTAIGYKVLVASDVLANKEVLDAILEHHEKYDGTGIPLGKSKDEINFYAKILQIADAYDSLTSTTSEALKMSPYQSVKWILSRAGKDYDPYVVNNFLKVVGMYPTGTKVKLSNGKVGMVLRSSGVGLLIPVVIVDDRLLDLSKDKSIWIESVVD